MGEVLCYKRVSSLDQNLDRQLPGFQCDREFVEKVSGKDMNRPALKRLLEHVRDGDQVHVHELSRLGRSMRDLLEIVETIVSKGATVRFHKENLTFGNGQQNPYSKFLFNLLSSLAEFERDLILERQREGIAIAKAKGVYKGKQSRFSDEDFDRIRSDFKETADKTRLARKWRISRSYLYKIAANPTPTTTP